MYRTRMRCFGFGNWIFLLVTLHLFTCLQGASQREDEWPPRDSDTEPRDVVAPLGARVTLPCHAPRDAAVTWRHAPTTTHAPLTPHHDIHAHAPHRKQLSNGTLVILSLAPQLAGKYQCAITRAKGTVLKRPIFVIIAELPEMLPSHPRAVSAVEGGPGLIPCPIKHDPQSPVTVILPTAPRVKLTPHSTHYVNVTWFKNGIPVQYNERISLSPSGALEIDPVRAQDGAPYKCTLYATSPHTHVSSEDIELRVESEPGGAGGAGGAEFPPTFVTTPLSATVIEGNSVTFDCAAVGNPKPDIMWLHNGVAIDLSDLDSRFYMFGSGSLVVQSTRPNDGGSYTCRATSRLDTQDSTVTLTLYTIPRVSLPNGPTAVAKPRGDVTLRCDVRGTPPPAVTWLKHGEVITPNNDIALIDGSSLRIQGVLPLDEGIFQCAADNVAGSALAAVTLTVRATDEPVTKTNKKPKPKTKLSTRKGSKPNHNQINSTQDIFNSLISTSSGQDLETDDLDELDQMDLGEASPAYTMRPELGFGDSLDQDLESDNVLDDYDDDTVQGDLNLDSLRPGNASLLSPPRNLQAVIVKPRFVTLSWTEPEVRAVDVTAYVIVYKVMGSERERMYPCSATQHTVNVGGLRPNTTYEVTAIALGKGAASPPSTSIEATTPIEELSYGPPLNVSVEPVDGHSVVVQWSPPEVQPPPDKYTVYYTEADTGREQIQWVSPLPSAIIKTKLTNLKAAALYYIRVSAVGGVVEEVIVRTPGHMPSAPPANVSAHSHHPNSIVVRWEAPPSRTHHGALTGYTIRYKQQGTKRKPDTLTTPADVRRAELTGLEPDTNYQIRVCALNANGSGPHSEWVTARTLSVVRGARTVPTQPSPLTTRAGRDWISVWWTDTKESEQAGIKSYILGWGLGVPDERTADLPSNQRSHVIRALEPNSEYVISLRAGNALGLGPPVYATVRTKPVADDGDDILDEEDLEEEEEDQQPPLIPPVGLKVIMLSGTTAVVYWTDPTLPKGQTATDGRRYVVRWSTAGSRTRTFNATDLNCMVDDLKPYTTYEFAVKLIKGGRESSWSMLVSNTTLEAAPSSPPRELRASAPSTGNPARGVELSWSPPIKPNGFIIGYVIMYAPAGSEEWSAVSIGGTTKTRVDRLRPHTTYHFKVQAKNSKGLGPFGPVTQFTTAQETGDGAGLATATSAWLWASAGGACAVLALAAALALSLCCRRDHEPPPTSTYQKSSASTGIKPPDLWIHHDQMELRHTDKSLRESHISAGSAEGALASSTLTLGRGDYEPTRRPPASLDRRTYVPTYVGAGAGSCAGSEDTAILRASPASGSYYRCDYTRPMTGIGNMGTMATSCNNTCERRAHGRPMHADQSTPLLSGVGPMSPQPSMGSLHPPLPPCGSVACGLGAACGAPRSGDIYASACRNRERGHYVAYEPPHTYAHRDSLSSEGGMAGGSTVGSSGAPPPLGGSLPRRPGPLHSFSDHSDHSTPSHSNRSVRESSPYKQSNSSSPGHAPHPQPHPPHTLHAHAPNRLQLGGTVSHHPEELEALTPSRSTEHLQMEMQNLEGLMKDLSAITQRQFEV